MLRFPLDMCEKDSKLDLTADFGIGEPFIGPRNLIENPRLRYWGNDRRATTLTLSILEHADENIC